MSKRFTFSKPSTQLKQDPDKDKLTGGRDAMFELYMLQNVANYSQLSKRNNRIL